MRVLGQILGQNPKNIILGQNPKKYHNSRTKSKKNIIILGQKPSYPPFNASQPISNRFYMLKPLPKHIIVLV